MNPNLKMDEYRLRSVVTLDACRVMCWHGLSAIGVDARRIYPRSPIIPETPTPIMRPHVIPNGIKRNQ